ncbi:MAG: 1-deoxy-D-xylulose-5-phosphate reductoisomerase [Candidatus Edwardsbacteria bacterium]|nr:1-deoxy-D-xylulose-5-phosphate reductoisomerase [Candidatus Edwardsbacteria bacterium]
MRNKNLIILGSTGSIGTQTIEVVRRHKDRFRVVGLAANSRFDLLARQIAEFRPAMVCAGSDHDQRGWQRTADRVKAKKVFGPEGLIRLSALPGADMAVNALVGAAGLEPTLAAIMAGHDVALANKETLVAGGELVMRAVKKYGVRLLPIDSEHAALHQCLDGRDPATVKRLILTASGGPFRNHARHRLHAVKARHALRHPTWRMGQKVSIDSATLMNKGLEVIEAHHLFGIPPERIEVVIHPESIIHSMAEFTDGSILAQLSVPDMRLPIQYALTYPERLPSLVSFCDLATIGKLTFHEPDTTTFKCLRLAYAAIARGGTMPAVMNAANEVAVRAFLEDRIGFMEIPRAIERVMRKIRTSPVNAIDDILAADARARQCTQMLIGH